MRAKIIGTGSCLPEVVVANKSFESAEFYSETGERLRQSGTTIVQKFAEITGIEHRRYVTPTQNASDIAYRSAHAALEDAGIDKESLDYLIVAHNFGDVNFGSNRVDIVPTLASRVKAKLQIRNPDCVAYDLPFGCPGWVEGVIQANYFIQSGDAKRCLVVGTETLSRVIDPHDRDSMIFSDGSGSVVLEATSGDNGVIAHKTQTFACEHVDMLCMGPSSAPGYSGKDLYIKMQGRKVYEFALKHVPSVIKAVIEKASLSIDDIKKILIHQANEKMDSAILDRVFQLYGRDQVPDGIMPMTIADLGNSSVATIPTLLDLVKRDKLPGHTIASGDTVVMASVGAGMNINALVYRF
ncbi:MAG: ketoacyl-ACP synthase III [Cyclobacteriaceae bacterium]|nr:ketoacyl-ACP synthase III [Cyclobacteriaceae bacterium]